MSASTTTDTRPAQWLAAKRAAYADPDHPPAVLPPALTKFQRIPDALRALPRWVVWKLVWRPKRKKDPAAGGQWAKVPHQPNGCNAKPNDPETWVTFEAAVAAYRAGGFDGVGFMLGAGFTGIDLDGVRDKLTGEVVPEAAAIVAEFATYTEVSPSGTGLKLIGRGEWRAGWNRKPLPSGAEIEAYGATRYFAVTALAAADHELADIQAAADALGRRLAEPKPKPAAKPATTTTRPAAPAPPAAASTLSDEDVILKASHAKNGAKFRRLWAGELTDHGGDWSRADLALCSLLVYWTGRDLAQVDRLFRRSALMRTEKWDERHRGDGATYGQMTVAEADRLQERTYTPRAAGQRRERPPTQGAGDAEPPDAGAPAAGAGGADEKPPKPPAAAEVLLRIGLALDLWHDPGGTGFATIGRVSFPVRSKAFKLHLTNVYRKLTEGKVPSSDAMAAALNAVEGAAVHDGEERPAYTRVAAHGGRVYLDLADPAATVIEVDAGGWRECAHPPVRFRRSPSALALPKPVPGGSVATLRRFLNLPDPADFALLVAWVTTAIRGVGPFPIAGLLGEQGSAKSTTARVLKRLIDPTTAPIRSEPKEPRDLMIAARNSWVLSYENLSSLPPWLSDALCSLATGGGFATRELYTDDGEIVFDSQRPVALNGIEDFITRADLLERSLLMRHPHIPEDKRVPESEFWAAFEAELPALLGALLDRVAAGLRALPGVRLARLPRMADFALFAAACDAGAGPVAPGADFLAAYAANQDGASQQALDASPISPALVKFMEGRDGWEGTPAELYDAITPTPAPKDWPRAANSMSGKLKRLAPDLRKVHGLEVVRGDEGRVKRGGKRLRYVFISRVGRDTPTTAAGDDLEPPGTIPGRSDFDGRPPPSTDLNHHDDEEVTFTAEGVGDDGDGPAPILRGRRVFRNDDRAF